MSAFAAARQKMVDGQVRPSDVTDIRILDAMRVVPREAFVPLNQRGMAYLDLDLDIREGEAAKRFLIKPAVIAKLLQAAEIKETDNVLVAGSAPGYVAVVVARLAGQGTGTETDPAQVAIAKEGLGQLGLGKVRFKAKAAAGGDAENAP